MIQAKPHGRGVENLSVALESISPHCVGHGEKNTGLWPDTSQLNALLEVTRSAHSLAAVLTAMLSGHWKAGGEHST